MYPIKQLVMFDLNLFLAKMMKERPVCLNADDYAFYLQIFVQHMSETISKVIG